MIFQKKENSRKTQHLEKVDAIVEQGAIACVLFLLERFFAIFLCLLTSFKYDIF